jgi:hypothetical protein
MGRKMCGNARTTERKGSVSETSKKDKIAIWGDASGYTPKIAVDPLKPTYLDQTDSLGTKYQSNL